MDNITEIAEKIKAISINCGASISDLKKALSQLEREQSPSRKNGRPLGVGNIGSQLDDHLTTISERLRAKDARGDIAASLGVSRQTLNEFIKSHLPEYHKSK